MTAEEAIRQMRRIVADNDVALNPRPFGIDDKPRVSGADITQVIKDGVALQQVARRLVTEQFIAILQQVELPLND